MAFVWPHITNSRVIFAHSCFAVNLPVTCYLLMQCKLVAVHTDSDKLLVWHFSVFVSFIEAVGCLLCVLLKIKVLSGSTV